MAVSKFLLVAGAQARRADELSRRLSSIGIPNIRSNSASFSIDPRDPAARALMEHNELIGNDELPAVFFNGRGKANPTLEDVTTEYRSGFVGS